MSPFSFLPPSLPLSHPHLPSFFLFSIVLFHSFCPCVSPPPYSFLFFFLYLTFTKIAQITSTFTSRFLVAYYTKTGFSLGVQRISNF